MVTALQTLVTRGFDVFDPVILTIGSFHSGSADNVIPDTASFEGTVRTFSAQAQAGVRDRALRLVRGIGEAHGLEVEAEYRVDYPVTVNDHAEAAFAGDTIREAYGEERFFESPRPFTGSEDFSLVCEEIPSAFVALGACPADRDPATAPYNHAPEAAFDDAVLADGAALYAELAVRRLSATPG
jgi:hippurate hydrolase